MNVGTSRCLCQRSLHTLQLTHIAVVVAKYRNAAVKFANQVSHIALLVEYNMSWTGAFGCCVYLFGGAKESFFGITKESFACVIDIKTPYTVVAKVVGYHVATVGSDAATVYMSIHFVILEHAEILAFRSYRAVLTDRKHRNVATVVVGSHKMTAIYHNVAGCCARHVLDVRSCRCAAMLAVDERKLTLGSVKTECTCTTSLVVVFVDGIHTSSIIVEDKKRRIARLDAADRFSLSAFLVEAIYVYALRSALVGVSAYYHCEIVAGKRL